MKKTIFFIALIITGLVSGNVLNHTAISAASTIQSTFHTGATPSQIAAPQNLTIPKLGMQTTVEAVTLDKKGNMDVPNNVNNVGWYALGAKPGQRGNAVIDGHLDSETGPAVFYTLNTLEPGDEVRVGDTQEQQHVFEVVRKETYPVNEFPIDTIFGKSDEVNLNLITCAGVFDHTQKMYQDRVVIFTKLKK